MCSSVVKNLQITGITLYLENAAQRATLLDKISGRRWAANLTPKFRPGTQIKTGKTDSLLMSSDPCSCALWYAHVRTLHTLAH